MTIFLFFFVPFAWLVARSIYRVEMRLKQEKIDAFKKAEYNAWMMEQRQLRREQMFRSVGLDPTKSDRELDVPNMLYAVVKKKR